MSYIVEPSSADAQESTEEKSSLIAAMQEFKKSYEDKIKAFDSHGSDNCILQAKINFQQEWIIDLTEQNEMLVHTVEELEQEATERVLSLEEKLKQSSQSANEVMNGYSNMSLNLDCTFKEIGKLQSDVRNLVTLINRVRKDPDSSLDDLEFYTVSRKELINNSNNMRRKKRSIPEDEVSFYNQLEEKEVKIRELQKKVENYEQGQSCPAIKEKYNSLKQSMLDMRDALTAEVANKHDIILSLRRDVQILEEQCRKADQQTHFKDDIIKELRKENKQFKQEAELEAQEKKSDDENMELNEYKNITAQYEDRIKEQNFFIKKLQEETNQIRLCAQDTVNILQGEKEELISKISSLELELIQSNKIIENEEAIVQTEPYEIFHKQISLENTSEPFTENREIVPLNKDRCIRFLDESSSDSINVEYIKHAPLDFQNSTTDSSGESTKSILKRDQQSLKEVVDNLQDSVSQLITKETDSIRIRDRIKELELQVQENSEKDELIEVQNETLNIIETELQAWRLKESEVEAARNCREEEINNLKQIIDILSKNLENEKTRSENLEKAVDLYQNSIGTLQENEALLRKEVMDQKFTINNLQDSIVATKQALDDYRHKSNQEVEESNEVCTKLWSFTLQADEDIRNLFEEKLDFINLINSLRDENLMLEVKLFYSYQDIDVYEIRLLKYQTACKSLEFENVDLKQKMCILKNEKEEHETFITEISNQLHQCKYELHNLFTVLNDEQCLLEDESTSMNNHIALLQGELFTLSQKLALSVNCLQDEKEKNNYLHVEHAKKDFDINCLKNELIAVNEKLKEAASEVLNLKEKAILLDYRLQTYEDCVINLDRESYICQQNVQHCIDNMNITKDNYQIKVDECEKLKKQLEEQHNEMQTITYELKSLEASSNNKEENERKLKDKISAKECECKKMYEELTLIKSKLSESISNEIYLQQSNESLQTDFNVKIINLESEKSHLVRVIEGHDKRINFLNSELCRKEALLEEANNNLNGFYSAHENHMQNYQDGTLELKNEINNLMQAKDTLKAENENLRRQVEKLHVLINENKEKEILSSSELQRCLDHMETIEKEKDLITKQNEDLSKECELLKSTCNLKAVSVVSLEEKLLDSQNVCDHLRLESRNVVNNVKGWLDEQRKINVHLTEKLEDKNDVIDKLNEEKLILQDKIKKLNLKNNSSSRLQSSVTTDEQLYSLESNETPDYTSWDLDWDTNSTPNIILRRVESLTEDVQKTSYIWKNKFGDNEYIVSRDK